MCSPPYSAIEFVRSSKRKFAEMPDIPPPLIVEILSRLPLKSLCRFKFVSKNWLVLTNHPRFVRMHLSVTLCLGLLLYNPSTKERISVTLSLLMTIRLCKFSIAKE
ncbi:hypothetical protein EZV62_006221 [Acer yangbiense]|uniref:F-box domain-containing protein n=1 Tax=Acer yangbiense TaxID=1000413 RepID=A0A5C7IS45_9ROSI|nr:hypothetical protein EZV62_006221 [Acer yangbiense]